MSFLRISKPLNAPQLEPGCRCGIFKSEHYSWDIWHGGLRYPIYLFRQDLYSTIFECPTSTAPPIIFHCRQFFFIQTLDFVWFCLLSGFVEHRRWLTMVISIFLAYILHEPFENLFRFGKEDCSQSTHKFDENNSGDGVLILQRCFLTAAQ